MTIVKSVKVEQLHRSEDETTVSLIINSRPVSASWDTLYDEYQKEKELRQVKPMERSGWTPTPEEVEDYKIRKQQREVEEWTVLPRQAAMEDVTESEKEDYFNTRLKAYFLDQKERRQNRSARKRLQKKKEK